MHINQAKIKRILTDLDNGMLIKDAANKYNLGKKVVSDIRFNFDLRRAKKLPDTYTVEDLDGDELILFLKMCNLENEK